MFAILAPNSPEWLLACYGALAAGGVVTGINPLCTPGEVAALLRSHPAVADAAVIPVPDERAGELSMAYVVSAQQVTPQELIDYVAARVAPYKRIRDVAFTDAIPTSPSGKTLRRLLIARAQQRT